MSALLFIGSIVAAAYGQWGIVPWLFAAGLAAWYDTSVRERAAFEADRERRLRRELRRRVEDSSDGLSVDEAAPGVVVLPTSLRRGRADGPLRDWAQRRRTLGSVLPFRRSPTSLSGDPGGDRHAEPIIPGEISIIRRGSDPAVNKGD